MRKGHLSLAQPQRAKVPGMRHTSEAVRQAEKALVAQGCVDKVGCVSARGSACLCEGMQRMECIYTYVIIIAVHSYDS